jgi:hypothetical protein
MYILNNKKRISAWSLIFSNTIPLIGVVFFGWPLGGIIVLYWFENVVIGVLNVVRMLKARGPMHNTDASFKLNGQTHTSAQRLSLIRFFILHYGVFTLVHGVFVLYLFGPLGMPLDVLAFGAGSVLVSHFISYRVNFIGNKEYLRVNASMLFTQPYKRVIILHIVTLVGGASIMLFGAPISALVLLVVLKTAVDLVAHLWEHKKMSEAESRRLEG